MQVVPTLYQRIQQEDGTCTVRHKGDMLNVQVLQQTGNYLNPDRNSFIKRDIGRFADARTASERTALDTEDMIEIKDI